MNFAYCTDHRPVQPSHIESAVNQLCFMKPSTLIYVCLFSSLHSCKQGPSFELSSSVTAHAACQGRVDSESSSSLGHFRATISRQNTRNTRHIGVRGVRFSGSDRSFQKPAMNASAHILSLAVMLDFLQSTSANVGLT